MEKSEWLKTIRKQVKKISSFPFYQKHFQTRCWVKTEDEK
jgi:hypothetical protein